jgi:hypothetical protein
MYKIYTDRNENFQCEVSVKNASLKNSIARLIVESNEGPTLVFNGKIEGEKCIIPIKRLKGLLDEGSTGNVSLEVIVEDTFFKPWSDTFLVEEHTSVKVRVSENKQSSNKPIVKVKSVSKKQVNEYQERVCSGCKGHLGWTGGPNDKGISHGICNSCMERVYGNEAKDIISASPYNVVKPKTPPPTTPPRANENLTKRKRGINIFVPKKEIAMLCEQFGIRKRNFHKRKQDFVQILKEYFKANPKYNYHARAILSGIDDFLR